MRSELSLMNLDELKFREKDSILDIFTFWKNVDERFDVRYAW